MTRSAVVYTTQRDAAAGHDLAERINQQLNGDAPHALIVFASPSNNYHELLTALNDGCHPAVMIGCSSAGEFTNQVAGGGMTCAIGLHAPEMAFNAAIGRDIADDARRAAAELSSGFGTIDAHKYEHRAALILLDALAGYSEELIDELTTLTGGMHRFFGGGAGDDARFEQTFVFYGTEVHSHAAVALEILSNKPLGIGAQHGWQPASAALRVTESDQSNVLSLNVAPAAEAFAEHADNTRQNFDRANPIPFFLHNILGVKTPSGHKLRVPLALTEAGGIVCAADVPTGATAHLMSTGGKSAAEAAVRATRDAIEQVTSQGHKPQVAFFFDCVATRLRLGEDFTQELNSVGEQLGDTKFMGFNSYGQIVRAEGQFSGFHNCTAVVCVIPE